ncbi:MAG: hypothetical protein HWN79_12855 [Candidatus Lokiarchaeota archaeon]|nr:hypothetical protein [Candidatus Lokiarchaeota archaeon]
MIIKRGTEKYIIIASVLLVAFVSFTIIFGSENNTNLFQKSENIVKEKDAISPVIENINLETSGTPNETVRDYAYYRKMALNSLNITQEIYNLLSPNETKIIENNIYALWGYENGTLTEEEALALSDHNSPHIFFSNIIPFYPYPTFVTANDEEFKFVFTVADDLFVVDRIHYIATYLDRNHVIGAWDTETRKGMDLSVIGGNYEAGDIYSHSVGTGSYWVWDYWYVPITWFHGIEGKTYVQFLAECGTNFLDPEVKIVIFMIWIHGLS